MEPSSHATESAPTTELPVLAFAADACSACATRMAADQRYCVECGQRRGAARLSALDLAGERPIQAAAAVRPAFATRFPPATTLIAVVGTLLLAMGIGVFIGHQNDNSSTRNGSQTVTVIAPGLAASGAATTAPAPTPTTPATGAAAATPKKAAPKAAAPAAPAKTPPKAVHIGSSGTGPGYTGGKFTGNFFK